MNWSWLAGFFDGEGSISLRTTRMVIAIYQSGDIGKRVLLEIQVFLSERGIESTLYGRKKLNPLSKKELWELRLGKRACQISFIRGVLPHLKVKKVIAQDYLRYYTMFPIKKWWFYGSNNLGEENRFVWNIQ